MGTSLLRIETEIRDRLKRHCRLKGLVMGTLVTQILEEYLKKMSPMAAKKSGGPKNEG